LVEVGPGHRLAVNLTGISHDRVLRGHALVQPGQWAPTASFDASLEVLVSLDHDVSRRGAYQLYVGSGEYPARLRVLGKSALPPGDGGLVRIHLAVELPLLPGDRYVLRESGRGETVGGGEVLDVAPILPAARAHPSRSVDRVIEERGWVDADELDRLTGSRRGATVGRWIVAPARLVEDKTRVLDAVAHAGDLGLDVAQLDERQRALLSLLKDDVTVDAGRAWPAKTAAQTAAEQSLIAHPWLAGLRAAPWTPPDPASAGADRQIVRELVRRGLVVERDGAYFAPEAMDEAARVIAKLLEGSPGGVTVATIRDALGTTRKHVLPLLAHLDATGVTRRRGDLRIGGPRLPTGL
jgi:selenocysteine-specific elongation factor